MDKYTISLTTDRTAGGIATSLINYSKAMSIINIRHKVVLPKYAAVIKELEGLNNVDIHAYPLLVLRFLIITRLAFSQTLKRLFSNAQIIFLHNAKLIKHQPFPEKTFFICHSGKFRYLHLAKNIIFLSEATRRRFELEGVDGNKASLHVIGHGFEPVNRVYSNRRSNTKTIIVSGGRFVQKKCFRDLIMAANLLEKEQLDYEINIYGEGPLESELKGLISQLKLKTIHIHPWTRDLYDIFGKSDIFCLTSKEEPFGLILGEAMLCALPVVATTTDGPLAMLGDNDTEGKGGYLYHCGDTGRLAAILAKLCREPVLRKNLGDKARNNILENFSLESLAKNIQTIAENQ